MKNPFAVGDSLGITGILMGLILLVFTGLGLSLLVDKSLSLPSVLSSEKLRIENDSLISRINRLGIEIVDRSHKEKKAKGHREQAKLLAELEGQIKNAREEIGILQRLIKTEQESSELLAKGKESHRLIYREQVRMNEIGQEYAKVTTRLGKIYQDVKVKNISPLGISISHKNGASRLSYQEMPEDWREKLLYTAMEVLKAAAEERKREITAQRQSHRRDKENRKVRQSEITSQEIAILRQQIASLRMKHLTASFEASLARNKVIYNEGLRQSLSYTSSSYRSYNTSTGSYSSSRYRPSYRIKLHASKPLNSRKLGSGSLETWEQRAVRHERAKVKYAIRLVSLRSRLAVKDPTYIKPLINHRK